MTTKTRVTGRILPDILGIILTIVVGALLYFELVPKLHGEITFEDNDRKTQFRDKVSYLEDEGEIHITGNLEIGVLKPDLIRLIPDNCLTKLRINNVNIREFLPLCDFNSGEVFSLGKYLRAGENAFEATISNSGGAAGLQILAVPWDLKPLSIILTALTLVGLCLFSCMKKLELTRNPLAYIFLFGALLRFIYCLNTEPGERSYDSGGHIHYLFYVLENFSIPPAQLGWQTYQPPLYYFTTAIFMLPFKLLGMNDSFLLAVAQFVSLVFSSLGLAIGILAGHELWRQEKDRFYLIAYSSVLSVFPGITYTASRISNDTLLLPLGFLFLFFLLKWVNTRQTYFWYGAVVTLGFALITKGNSLAYIPIALTTFVYVEKSKLFTRSALLILLKSSLILFGLSAWFFIYRFAFEGEKHLVGNISQNDPGLFTNITLEDLIVLDPAAILRIPYIDNWSEEAGRRYLWNYLPKSAITGDWNFGETVQSAARLIHLISFLLVPCAVLRLARDVLNGKNYVAWLSILFPILSVAALVLREKNCGLQDFRYVTIVTVPVTFYALQGLQVLPQSLRNFGKSVVCLYIILCLLLMHNILVAL